MKPLTEYMNIHEDSHTPEDYENASKIVKECIKELETSLASVMGIRNIKLNVSSTSKKVTIESDNLLPQLKDGLWSVLFNDIRFETWGGNFTKDGKIWFNPMFSWTYAKNSGSNGHEFGFYRNIWFDPNTKEWIFDK